MKKLKKLLMSGLFGLISLIPSMGITNDDKNDFIINNIPVFVQTSEMYAGRKKTGFILNDDKKIPIDILGQNLELELGNLKYVSDVYKPSSTTIEGKYEFVGYAPDIINLGKISIMIADGGTINPLTGRPVFPSFRMTTTTASEILKLLYKRITYSITVSYEVRDNVDDLLYLPTTKKRKPKAIFIAVTNINPKPSGGPTESPISKQNRKINSVLKRFSPVFFRTSETAGKKAYIATETSGSPFPDIDGNKIKLSLTGSGRAEEPAQKTLSSLTKNPVSGYQFVGLAKDTTRSDWGTIGVHLGTAIKTFEMKPTTGTATEIVPLYYNGSTYEITVSYKVKKNVPDLLNPTTPVDTEDTLQAVLVAVTKVEKKASGGPSGPSIAPFDVANEVALYVRTKDTVSPFTAIKLKDGSDQKVDSEKIKLEIAPSPITAAPGDIITTAKYVTLVGKLAKKMSHTITVKIGANTENIIIPANIPDGDVKLFPFDVTVSGNTYIVTLAVANKAVTFKDPALTPGNAYIVSINSVKPKPTTPSGPSIAPFDITNEVAVYIQASDSNNPANAVTDSGGPFISHLGAPLAVKIGIAAGLTKKDVGSQVDLKKYDPNLKFIGVIDQNNPSTISINLGGRPGQVTLPLGIGAKTSLPTVVIDLYKVNLTVEKQAVVFPAVPGITGNAYVIKAQITPPTRQEILEEVRRRRH